MAQVHINSSTNQIGVCEAQPGNCPVGGDGDHFGSRQEAEKELERRLEQKKQTGGRKSRFSKPVLSTEPPSDDEVEVMSDAAFNYDISELRDIAEKGLQETPINYPVSDIKQVMENLKTDHFALMNQVSEYHSSSHWEGLSIAYDTAARGIIADAGYDPEANEDLVSELEYQMIDGTEWDTIISDLSAPEFNRCVRDNEMIYTVDAPVASKHLENADTTGGAEAIAAHIDETLHRDPGASHKEVYNLAHDAIERTGMSHKEFAEKLKNGKIQLQLGFAPPFPDFTVDGRTYPYFSRQDQIEAPMVIITDNAGERLSDMQLPHEYVLMVTTKNENDKTHWGIGETGETGVNFGVRETEGFTTNYKDLRITY